MTEAGTLRIAASRRLSGGFVVFTRIVLLTAVVFGGGARQGLWSDVVAELVSLPLLGWATIRLTREGVRGARWLVALLFGVFLLLIVQLIPLPPAVWTSFPLREPILAALQASGVEPQPWLPLSLSPAATWFSLLSLIPAAAIFLSALSLDQQQRRSLIVVLLIIAMVDACIGFLQLGGRWGYFYNITNEGMAVGFFANGNHNAAFLASCILYGSALLIDLSRSRHTSRVVLWSLCLLLVSLAIGVSLVGSRAGLGLGFLACACALALGYHAGVISRRWMLIIAGIGLLVLVQFVFFGWQHRNIQVGAISDDLRWMIAKVTWQAAQAAFPTGTGFGSFVPIYQMFVPRSQEFEYYINHAHNDWLEALLEGGLFVAVLAGLYLGWFAVRALTVWFRNASGASSLLARASSIMVSLVALHSVVDYPLRTIGVMSLFALSSALLLPGAEATDPRAREFEPPRSH